MDNSIPIHRDTLKHWIYTDSDYFKIWVTMLAKARYMSEPKHGIYHNINYTLNRGEFIFGRKKWNEDTGVSEQKLRTLLKKLIKEEMIVNVLTTSKFTIYSIKNYEKFNQQPNQQQSEETQEVEDDNEPAHQPPDNQHLTSNQPASNQHLTTNKECSKKEKKVKTEKKEYIYTDFIKNPELIEAIESFIEMRKSRKKPMTDNAVKLMINKLNRLASDDITKIEILNQSVMCGWTDIYEFKQTKLFNSKGGNKHTSAVEDFFGGANGATDRGFTNRPTAQGNDFETINVSFSKCED